MTISVTEDEGVVATRKTRKSSKPKAAIVSPPALPGQQLIDIGRSVALTIKKASAEEIILTLSDGAVVHVRPVVVGIERSKEKYNALGEPIYQLNLGLVLHTKVPQKLKKKMK